MSLRSFVFRNSWDTRCRNLDVARLLEEIADEGSLILDAGCGDLGISPFMPGRRVIGVDIPSAGRPVKAADFVHASILDLPFAPKTFDITVSVDVFEHLPAELRERAIEEMVRVSRRSIILAFPDGARAREIDEAFATALGRTGQPLPEWLAEHLANEYPDADEIVAMLMSIGSRHGNITHTTLQWSESIRLAKLLRQAAATSKYIYLAGNVAAGLIASLIPRPRRDDAYRAIIVATLDE